jgi:hypothetical protein
LDEFNDRFNKFGHPKILPEGTVGGKHALQDKPGGTLVSLKFFVVGQGQVVPQLRQVDALVVLLTPLGCRL